MLLLETQELWDWTKQYSCVRYNQNNKLKGSIELRVTAQPGDNFLHRFVTTTQTFHSHLNHCYVKPLICAALNFSTTHFYSTTAFPAGNTSALVFPYFYTLFNELATAPSLYVHYKSAK